VVTKDPKQLFGRYSRLPLMLSSTTFSLCAVLYAKPLITPVAITCLIAYKYVKKPFGWGIRQVKSLPAKRNRTRIFVAHNICTYNMKTQERAFQDRLGTNKQKERPSLLTKECVFVRFLLFRCVFVRFRFSVSSRFSVSRQVYGGLVKEVQVGMRKFSGEIYDATPTIVAMGRQPQWCEKRVFLFCGIRHVPFLSSFPMFVPSLSKIVFKSKLLKKGHAFLAGTR